MSPASRAIDTGPRRELYRRSRAPHLWLIDPERETLLLHVLDGTVYRTTMLGANDSFDCPLFPGEIIRLRDWFETQNKRHGTAAPEVNDEPIPEWFLPAEKRLGLEYFFLLGHDAVQ